MNGDNKISVKIHVRIKYITIKYYIKQRTHRTPRNMNQNFFEYFGETILFSSYFAIGLSYAVSR